MAFSCQKLSQILECVFKEVRFKIHSLSKKKDVLVIFALQEMEI